VDTLRPFSFSVLRRGRQGLRGLIAGRFLPPAGLNHIKRKHWARWMAKPFYLATDALVLWSSTSRRNPERGDYRIDPKVFRPARLEERVDAGSPVPP
jgi:hypothetical protein